LIRKIVAKLNILYLYCIYTVVDLKVKENWLQMKVLNVKKIIMEKHHGMV